jgi:glycerol-3-phosphate acyltransferase PlsX
VSRRVTIAVDAMGGDYAPASVVQGAYLAAQEMGDRLNLVLVGSRDKIQEYLDTSRLDSRPFDIEHAPEEVLMGERPTAALRRKKGSSIAVALGLHKHGQADAVLSAGNTGAVVASALLTLGRLEGVLRPAIATSFPTERGATTLLDMGANPECKPANLLQFGVMGSIYESYVHSKQNPRIGLLSIGEEATKGNDLILAAHKLFSESPLNFVGNIEGQDILKGAVDVVVTDGFTGNVILKFTGSLLSFLNRLALRHVKRDIFAKLGVLLLKSAFRSIKRTLDYTEYGGAPLLGVNGVCIICHGGSSPKAIKSGIKLAYRMVADEVNDHIKKQLFANSYIFEAVTPSRVKNSTLR